MAQRRFDRGATIEIVPATGPGFRVEYARDLGLSMSFAVKRSLSLEANTAVCRIYNLNERSRLQLTGQVKRRIDQTISLSDGSIVLGGSAEVTAAANQIAYLKISAGYGAEVQQLFEGTSHRIDVRHEDVDWIAELEAGDGELGLRGGVIAESFAPGTPLYPIVLRLVQSMGVLPGNLTPASLASAAGESIDFPYGFAAVGRASEVLSELLRLLEVRFSIQDGEFVILDAEGTLPDPPIVLTGAELLERPRRLEGDAVEVHTHLEPRLKPGRRVVIESRDVQGNFAVEEVEHTGETHGDTWDSVAELRDISLIPGVL